MQESEFLIIGSGVAGLSLALALAEHGIVHVVTKKDLSDSNTNLAQGGIAGVMGADDSFASHVEDTLRCGAGLCRRDVVEMVVREGPQRIDDLVKLGVPFTTEGTNLSLGLEGGHSHKRIVHCDDLTGREVEQQLLQAVLAHERIAVFRYHMAINLIADRHLREPTGNDNAVFGAYVLNTDTDEVEAFAAHRTILASGGAGKVYLYTTNPDIATGDGIAMSYRAGARIANLEFVQFHPTCLYHSEATSFLLSEALRGEGGRLLRASGKAFMHDYHERGELAPRDVVARAIDAEMKHTGDPCMYLDMTHRDDSYLRGRFPNISARLAQLGIDISRDPIPVVPATHYFCGGVDVDDHGRTSLDNLLALGEVSHTGLHGANRLASNSLLEALVFSRRTHVAAIEGFERGRPVPQPQPWQETDTNNTEEAVILEHDWDDARRIMWDYVGIVRSDRRLEIARQRMSALADTVESLYWSCRLSKDLLELRNIIVVGGLIIASALRRKESRGLHYTETYPHQDDRYLEDTVIAEGGTWE